MGEISTIYSDYVLVTSDNPRSEDPKIIIEEICKGINPSKINKISIIEDRREAIKVACEMANQWRHHFNCRQRPREISNNRI